MDNQQHDQPPHQQLHAERLATAPGLELAHDIITELRDEPWPDPDELSDVFKTQAARDAYEFALQEALEAIENRLNRMESMLCIECGVDTGDIDEYYMVQDEVWHHVNPDRDGMLCIGCLEKRLGRKLTPADFIECPLNDDHHEYIKSARLLDRMGQSQDQGQNQ